MDNAALRIAEVLNQPVKVWMVIAVCSATRVITYISRLLRARVHKKDVVSGITERKRAYQAARLKQDVQDAKLSPHAYGDWE